MALISRWDIREESYSDGNDVTSLTEQVSGVDDLGQIASGSLPDYVSATDSMDFNGGESIGLRGGVSSALNTACQGSVWTIAALIRQGTLSGDWTFSLAQNGGNLSLSLRTNSSGNAICFFRDAGGTATSVTSSTSYSVDTDTVIMANLTSGGIVNVSIDGGTLTSSGTTSVDTSGDTFAHIGIGSYNRSSNGNFWTGLIQEVRVYDTDETANRVAITADMKAGPGGGGTILPFIQAYYRGLN